MQTTPHYWMVRIASAQIMVQILWGRRGRMQCALYEDVAGFCASVLIVRVAELDYVLTLGRYVGLPEDEALNRAIADNLARIQL